MYCTIHWLDLNLVSRSLWSFVNVMFSFVNVMFCLFGWLVGWVFFMFVCLFVCLFEKKVFVGGARGGEGRGREREQHRHVLVL